MRCFAELSESVEPDSNKILLSKLSEYFADLTNEEKEIYLNMTRGCVKQIKPIKDLLEAAYATRVCWKKNDNKVNSKQKVIIQIVITLNISTLIFKHLN